jgi:trimeric autotransporter adhesin
MSQAGIVDFIGTHPQVPVSFVANVGTAVPIGNTLEILGSAVAAHSIPLQTVGSGNTINIDVQYASAAPTSVATNAGIASFNSADFTVDANGFVTLAGTAASQSFQVDASTAPGTNPVTPNTSGVVTITGGQVAAGTTANVIRTDSLAANTYTIQIQRSQAVGVSTIADNGVSHFNSTYFTVDANGFVSINGGSIGETITGNTGGALLPTAGNWNIVGTGSITTSGSVSTLTVQLTGLTNHAIQVGAGTATLTQVGPTANTGAILQNNAGADPSYSTATYPSTTTINQIIYSSAANTVSGLATVNSAVLVTTSAGIPTFSGTMTNGQLIIGSTGGTPTAATLTAGPGVSITNAAGSITISAAGGAMTWTTVTASTQAAAISNGYITNNATGVTITLPATAAIGDIVEIMGLNAGGWTLAPNSGQNIRFGTANTTVSLASTAQYDTIRVRCLVANTQWSVVDRQGNITVN